MKKKRLECFSIVVASKIIKIISDYCFPQDFYNFKLPHRTDSNLVDSPNSYLEATGNDDSLLIVQNGNVKQYNLHKSNCQGKNI